MGVLASETGSYWWQSATNRYVYDGMLAVQERDGSNNALVSYTRGRDLSGSLQGAGGIGGLLARTDHASAAPHAYYHADGVGNITAMVDSSQLLSATYRYDAYGVLLSSSGSIAAVNVYRFSSKEWQPSPGLYYFGYRFYDPNLQRWPNRDPLGEEGGFNLHGFVGNTPLNLIDDTGERPIRPGPGNPGGRKPQATRAVQTIDWRFHLRRSYGETSPPSPLRRFSGRWRTRGLEQITSCPNRACGH